MGVGLEILDVILRMMWSVLESVYRMVVQVPRKKIDGEVVLITGGGGRIAECIAMEMAKLNVTIVLWDINEDANKRVADKVRAQGATVHTFCCDLTDREEVYRVAEEVKTQIGHVTLLVNNAGILYGRSLMNCTDKQLVKQFEINTISHFWTTKAFLPHMYEFNYGHVVTIASIAGLNGVRNLIGYSASKHAAVGFHKSLRRELHSLGKDGVKTTCVCPTIVDTPLVSDVTYSPRFPSHFPALTPEDVAKDVVDGILRDKNIIVLPKSLRYTMMVTRFLPERAIVILGDYLSLEFIDEDAHMAFQRLKQSRQSR